MEFTMKIGLIVEDNEIIGRILKHYLSKKYEVDIAITAKLAINKVQKNIYDFIILDLGLPDMRGNLIIPFIKESDFNKNTPILIYSAYSLDKKTNDEYISIGANAILTKPVHDSILHDNIDNILNVNNNKYKINQG